MKLPHELWTLTAILSAIAHASFIPLSSLSETAQEIKDRGWGKKHKHERPPEQDRYPKYFHEPDGSQALHHYDSRYHEHVLGFDEKTDTQIHLVRSYVEFFRAKHLETWMAHGTLLGWWWNGRLLPWDWDIDTQVSIATMYALAENFNTTYYDYTSKTDTEFDPSTSKQVPIKRRYHLDVNPAIYTRHRSEGDNIIDARWLDMRNGLYIDITAVAETRPGDSPGIWACKNYHRYRTRDLWPMREATFEGVTAKVPYDYLRILREEYGEKAFAVDEFQSHRWSAADHVWVKKTPNEIKAEEKSANKEAALRRQKQEAKAEKYLEEHERQKGKLFLEDEHIKEDEKKAREGRRQEVAKDKEAAQKKDDASKNRAREKR